MKNGICPHCGSHEIFQTLNGIISGDKQVYVRKLSRFTPASDKMTYICTHCGYYANYIPDAGILEKIALKWDRVPQS